MWTKSVTECHQEKTGEKDELLWYHADPHFDLKNLNKKHFSTGLGNIRPAGHMRPAMHLNVAREHFLGSPQRYLVC
jgi:hypothetical protein